jgi:hypothetical protein
MKAIRSIAVVLLASAVIVTLISSCARQSAAGLHFGEPFTQAPVVTIGQLLEKPDDFQRKSVRVKGTIERQCPMAGCWFFITDGKGRSLKVELGDYLPKLPQNIGNTAEAEGELIKKGDKHEFIGTRVTFTRKGTQ